MCSSEYWLFFTVALLLRRVTGQPVSPISAGSVFSDVNGADLHNRVHSAGEEVPSNLRSDHPCHEDMLHDSFVADSTDRHAQKLAQH